MRQRTKHVGTLPSSTIPTIDLPEDPKRWSPTHLSTYLSSTLRGAGAGEVPDQVTRDITVFFREKQITGKTFLRLNEGDLEGYVFFFFLVFPSFFLSTFLPSANNWIETQVRTPTTYHTHPLSASRSLRQNVLRDQMGGSSRAISFSTR